jgi:hypothetical protein
MNDPHVVALRYRVECDYGLSYNSTDSPPYCTETFVCTIADRLARFEFKPSVHHASESTARAEIDPFVEAWKIRAELNHGQGVFRLGVHSTRYH